MAGSKTTAGSDSPGGNDGATRLFPDLEESTEQLREWSSRAIASAKTSGAAGVDAYEKGVAGLVGLQRQVAGSVQSPLVAALIEAQSKYAEQVGAAYAGAARELLK